MVGEFGVGRVREMQRTVWVFGIGGAVDAGWMHNPVTSACKGREIESSVQQVGKQCTRSTNT